MAPRDAQGRWLKGTSPNPGGRPKGRGPQAEIEHQLLERPVGSNETRMDQLPESCSTCARRAIRRARAASAPRLSQGRTQLLFDRTPVIRTQARKPAYFSYPLAPWHGMCQPPARMRMRFEKDLRPRGSAGGTPARLPDRRWQRCRDCRRSRIGLQRSIISPHRSLHALQPTQLESGILDACNASASTTPAAPTGSGLRGQRGGLGRTRADTFRAATMTPSR